MWVLLLLVAAIFLREGSALSGDDGDDGRWRYQHFEYSEELAKLALVSEDTHMPCTEQRWCSADEGRSRATVHAAQF